MGYFIIIRGPLGVGKSSIAKKLSRILRAEYVPVDLVLEKYGLDKISGGCIPLASFIKADDLILPEIGKKLESGRIAVFDGCFYHKRHIKHLVRRLPYTHYVFSLKAPLEVCIKRDSRRKKGYGKAAATAVYGLVSKFDYGIAIDASGKSTARCVNEILSRLPRRARVPKLLRNRQRKE